MKTYRGFPIFVWVLLGLLAISAALVSLGNRELQANPAANSYDPSGSAALAQLLARNGYQVRIDRFAKPHVRPGETAIAFLNSSGALGFGRPSTKTFRYDLRQVVQNGAQAIIVRFDSNFDAASHYADTARPRPVRVLGTDKTLNLSSGTDDGGRDEENLADEQELGPTVSLWTSNDQPVLRASQVGKGRVLSVRDGLFVSNRYLDKNDNAEAALAMVRLIAPAGSSVVFTEAGFTKGESPGLLESIGPWAYAGWQQTLLLGLVVVVTLGKRFGIPDESRTPQSGTRQLLEALADTYLRGRHTKAAMESALEHADRKLRTALRLPRDATRAERDRLLPEGLIKALARLEAAAKDEKRTAPVDALALIQAVRKEADAFMGVRRAQRSL